MTTSQNGLLRNRLALVIAGVFCTYEAISRTAKLLRIAGATPINRDAILIAGMMAATVIAILVAVRSPSNADRFIFGTVAVASVMRLTVVLLLGDSTLGMGLDWGVSFAWAIAAIGAFLFMARNRPSAEEMETP